MSWDKTGSNSRERERERESRLLRNGHVLWGTQNLKVKHIMLKMYWPVINVQGVYHSCFLFSEPELCHAGSSGRVLLKGMTYNELEVLVKHIYCSLCPVMFSQYTIFCTGLGQTFWPHK